MRDSSGLARPHSVSELDEDEVAEPLSSESDDALPRLLSCGKHFRHLFAQGSSPLVKLAPPRTIHTWCAASQARRYSLLDLVGVLFCR